MTENSDRRPILVPVDFSAPSEAALVWAVGVANRLGLPLLVLHVVHDPAEAPGYYQKARGGNKPTEELRQISKAAAELMGDFMDGVGQRFPALQSADLRTALVVGIPARRILEVAETENAQQIVMGSQGRTGLARLLLGSKAEQVVRLAPIPVTIIKAEPTPRGRD